MLPGSTAEAPALPPAPTLSWIVQTVYFPLLDVKAIGSLNCVVRQLSVNVRRSASQSAPRLTNRLYDPLRIPRAVAVCPAWMYMTAVAVPDAAAASVTIASCSPLFSIVSWPGPPDAFLTNCPLASRRFWSGVLGGRKAPNVYPALDSSFTASRVLCAASDWVSRARPAAPAQIRVSTSPVPSPYASSASCASAETSPRLASSARSGEVMPSNVPAASWIASPSTVPRLMVLSGPRASRRPFTETFNRLSIVSSVCWYSLSDRGVDDGEGVGEAAVAAPARVVVAPCRASGTSTAHSNRTSATAPPTSPSTRPRRRFGGTTAGANPGTSAGSGVGTAGSVGTAADSATGSGSAVGTAAGSAVDSGWGEG